MKPNSIKALVVVAGLATLSGSAFAQRDAPSREDRRTQRRQENANLTPEQRQQNMQNRMQQRMQSMTPEQRARMQQRMQEMQQNGQGQDGGAGMADWQGQGQGQDGGFEEVTDAKGDQMRAAMIAASILDSQVQDEIIAFIRRQETVRSTLLQVAQTAAQSLLKPTTQQVAFNGGAPAAPAALTAAGAPAAAPVDAATADTDVAKTFDAYETALATEKDRYTEDLKDLDSKVKYSTTPRIKSFLALIGVLNFESYALGGPETIFASPNAGRGGRGQGGRGNRGQGQGGQNGQWQAAQGGGQWQGGQGGQWQGGQGGQWQGNAMAMNGAVRPGQMQPTFD